MVHTPPPKKYLCCKKLSWERVSIIIGCSRRFENEKDTRMKWWVSMFQKYDLYTKCNKKIDEVKARKYYNNIVNKYFPKYIYW